MDSSILNQQQTSMSLQYLARKLREKGIIWFVRRGVWKGFRLSIGYLVLLCLHILMIVKPFKAITIARIRSDRIGHLAYNTDIFLRQLDSKKYDGKRILVVGVAGEVANQQLLSMYRRKFPIIQNKTAHTILGWLPIRKSGVFQDLELLDDTNCPYYRLDNTKPNLYFTPGEEITGRELLKQMGISDNTWFVCFHARDFAYLSGTRPDRDWNYHNYRDSDIKHYLEAARYITRSGGFAVRVGYLVSEKLPELHEPRIIDYPSYYRSDFGDIYLPAKCKFFLGDTAGIFLVATIFGVPVACANFPFMELLTAYRKGDLFIPKKIWSIELKRFLTFGETFESGVGRYLHAKEYLRAGLEVVENTTQEILDLCREMNERLDGTYECSEEDEELQRRFHSLIRPHHYCYGTPARIGANFLRENRQLLD
jgi:putative glycosyltransferase (TIGR04372 family)